MKVLIGLLGEYLSLSLANKQQKIKRRSILLFVGFGTYNEFLEACV
jgi:hypothetical protein